VHNFADVDHKLRCYSNVEDPLIRDVEAASLCISLNKTLQIWTKDDDGNWLFGLGTISSRTKPDICLSCIGNHYDVMEWP